jgi:hypothetical protein
MQKEWEIGDTANLKHPEHYKGYRHVEIVDFYGLQLVVEVSSGWRFNVWADELED